MTSRSKQQVIFRGRLNFVMGVLGIAAGVLIWRMVDLHIYDHDFLKNQGDARHLRVMSINAHRGMITDRHGEPLAISTPVESVWAHPGELLTARQQWPQLAKELGLSLSSLERLLSQKQGKEFVYLRRHVNPQQAERVMALSVPGVSLQREYRRYYPTGEVSAHVVGFTNIDDAGQEGIELMLDDVLRGEPGSKRVIKDRLGHVVENVESISDANPGKDIQLSLDRRIQYLAYRELKAAVTRHMAKAGSAVVMDVKTGEVLAMVNQPSYNPNNRQSLRSDHYRNRAVTDVFEPGSTIKPFTVSAGLESGRFRPETAIDTSPGKLRMAGFTIRDIRDYGRIDVATVIQKSSNVGASRIALALEPQRLWETFSSVGFGFDTGSGFPGESAGLLNHFYDWRELDRATISYGYGLSVTPLQLAQAYSVLANEGRLRPVSFLKLDNSEIPRGREALETATITKVRTMLERVVQKGGTGTMAAIPGYRVAGKTGTVRKAGIGGYKEEHYLSVFAGMAPVSNPRLAMVVMVDDPDSGEYYGGTVAAPVFANVIDGALRLLGVAPDEIQSLGMKVAMVGGEQ